MKAARGVAWRLEKIWNELNIYSYYRNRYSPSYVLVVLQKTKIERYPFPKSRQKKPYLRNFHVVIPQNYPASNSQPTLQLLPTFWEQARCSPVVSVQDHSAIRYPAFYLNRVNIFFLFLEAVKFYFCDITIP